MTKGSAVAPRELFEKKAYFQLKQALVGLDKTPKAEQLKNGCENDIYIWLTSIPNEVAPEETSEAVRIIRELGFLKIGRCKDLPESRRQEKGIYVHDRWVSDPQVNWLMMKLGHKFIVGAKAESSQTLHDYLK